MRRQTAPLDRPQVSARLVPRMFRMIVENRPKS